MNLTFQRRNAPEDSLAEEPASRAEPKEESGQKEKEKEKSGVLGG